MVEKMSRFFVRLSWMGGGMAIALSTLALLSPSASAQVSANPNEGFSNPEETRDVFSDNADMGDMLDMIHQANFGNSRTTEEIQLDRRNNIQNAADLFRQQQRDRLQQRQPQPQPQPQTQPQTPSTPNGL